MHAGVHLQKHPAKPTGYWEMEGETANEVDQLFIYSSPAHIINLNLSQTALTGNTCQGNLHTLITTPQVTLLRLENKTCWPYEEIPHPQPIMPVSSYLPLLQLHKTHSCPEAPEKSAPLL